MTKGNHAADVAAMAKLAEPWKPIELAGFRIGDAVRLPYIECTFEIVGFADPLLILRAPSGKEIRAGWRACSKP